MTARGALRSRPHLDTQDGAASVCDAAPGGARLLVVGATNRPDALDPALRRPGRFDREIEVPVPDAAARCAILELHASRLPRAPELDLMQVAADCHGYSGADMAGTCAHAAAPLYDTRR